MKAVLLDRPGDEDVLYIGEAPRPTLTSRDLRIRVAASAVNRADILQRHGSYPPPPGASPILGLECSGEIVEIGSDVVGWQTGQRVMALLPGGGYAEEAVVDAGSAMHVPDVLSDEEAAGMPEVFLTAFLNIFLLARGAAGETALIHGGGSGVGTAATTLCKLARMRVIVTAGSREKCERCLAHGADAAINYREEDFAARAGNVDVILDHVGARYFSQNVSILNMDGRLVVIGSMGGETAAELDVSRVLGKRHQIIGSTLRNRSAEMKASIVEAFVERFERHLQEGRIRPVIDRVFPWDEVDQAHRRMERSEHFGKIVLRVR